MLQRHETTITTSGMWVKTANQEEARTNHQSSKESMENSPNFTKKINAYYLQTGSFLCFKNQCVNCYRSYKNTEKHWRSCQFFL